MATSYVKQAPKTCIILHHSIWKYRGHFSYQAKNKVVFCTIPWGLKKGLQIPAVYTYIPASKL